MEAEQSPSAGGRHSLFSLLQACQRGQRFAVVGSHVDIDDSITPFLHKLYVDETPQDEIIDRFFVDEYQDDGKLLVITGSAGDGKSALLSKGYLGAQEAGHTSVTEARVNMDATATDEKHQRYNESLDEFFDTVLSDIERESGPRSGLAINYGLAVEYFEHNDVKNRSEQHQAVWEALKNSREDPNGIEGDPRDDTITVLNLSQRELYSTHPDSFGEGLLKKILDRFNVENEDSPLHDAFVREAENCPAGEQCPLRYNVEQFASEAVRTRVAEIIAGWNIITGLYFNPRSILDLTASTLLPDINPDRLEQDAECPVGAVIDSEDIEPSVDDLLWNRLFNVLASADSQMANRVDPLARTSIDLDTRVLSWRGKHDSLQEELSRPPGADRAGIVQLIRTRLRYQYLVTEADENLESIDALLESEAFKNYQATLTLLNNDDVPREKELGNDVGQLFSTVMDSLQGWSGRRGKGNEIEFVDARRSPGYRFLSRWGDPSVNREQSEINTRRQTVPGRISLHFNSPGNDVRQAIRIPLTFELYQLMIQISNGYTPSGVEIEHSEAVTQIKSNLSDLTRKRDFVRVINRSNSREFTVKQNEFGSPTIKRQGEWG